MQDGEDSSALLGVEVLVGVPGSGGGSSLRLSVSDNGDRDLVGAVHHRSERDGKGVAELTSLVDGTRSLSVDVRGEAAGERESLNELLEAVGRGRVVGVEVLPSALEVEGREDGGSAVTRLIVSWPKMPWKLVREPAAEC